MREKTDPNIENSDFIQCLESLRTIHRTFENFIENDKE